MFYAALLSVCFLIADFNNYCFLRIVHVCICEHRIYRHPQAGRGCQVLELNLQEYLVLLTAEPFFQPFYIFASICHNSLNVCFI